MCLRITFPNLPSICFFHTGFPRRITFCIRRPKFLCAVRVTEVFKQHQYRNNLVILWQMCGGLSGMVFNLDWTQVTPRVSCCCYFCFAFNITAWPCSRPIKYNLWGADTVFWFFCKAHQVIYNQNLEILPCCLAVSDFLVVKHKPEQQQQSLTWHLS